MINVNTLQTLYGIYHAVGAALPITQQIFVSAQWQNLPGFLQTGAGQLALQMFIQSWEDALTKPAAKVVALGTVPQPGVPAKTDDKG